MNLYFYHINPLNAKNEVRSSETLKAYVLIVFVI
jgi:hypothetical protein